MADSPNSKASDYQQLGSTIFFAPVQPEQLEQIYALESASYPPDEAATYDKLKFRIENAPNAFMVALQSRDGDQEPVVVGFSCGTCTTAGRLTHESMAKHEPEGSLLCIHSVVIDESLRGKGLATRLLRAYTAYVQATTPQLRGIRLICKSDLIPLYERAGFSLLGPSDVVHGRDPWFEMGLELQE